MRKYQNHHSIFTNYFKLPNKPLLYIFANMLKPLSIALIFSLILFKSNAQSTYSSKESDIEVNYSKAIPEIDGEIIISYPEIRPQYPGGEKTLQENIQNHLEYDIIAFWEGVEGKIITSFLIHKDGSVSNIQVIKGLHPELDKAVVKHLSDMPKWTPGELNHEIVTTYNTLTVKYKIGRTKKLKDQPDF